MTDAQKLARDEAATEWRNDGCYAGTQMMANARTRWADQDFKAGADFWHARAKCLERCLEFYACSDTYINYGDVILADHGEEAREALAEYRGGAE